MAAIPFMPLYVADYLSDAAHLSTLEHGAYLMLIMTYWQRGEALPDDDRKLARICRCEPRTWNRLRLVISEFFEVSDGKWLHRRVERELCNVRAKSLKKREGGLARAKQMHSNRSARAQQSDTDTDTDTEVKAYAFTAGAVRLTKKDYADWRARFHAIPDFDAELVAMADWLRAKPADKQAKWFGTGSSWLNKRHQEGLATRQRAGPLAVVGI